MEPLVLQPVEEWSRVRDYFMSCRPLGIVGYNLIDTQIHYNNLRLDCAFQVYAPYGDIANGMVAKIQKDKLHEVIVMATSEDTYKLEQALLNSSVIDWSKGRTEVPAVMPGSTRTMLDRVYPKLGLKLVMEGPGYMHIFDRNSEPFTKVKCPEGIHLAPVRPENVPQIDRVWPYRYPSSNRFFTLLIQAGQSYGLFSSLDYSLIAWIFISENERHEVIIMTTSDNTSKLEQAILNSSVIDWSEGRTEVSDVMPGSTRDMLDRVYPRIGLKLVKESFSYMHVFDINSEPYANVTYPEGTYVAAVRPEHVSQVDRAWPHRYTSSDLFFTLLIQAGQSYGLFFSADDSLVAWLFINEAGYLCHLYCGEQHRRKGYAEFMVKHVTNDQISKRKRVFCHICEGNVKSMQLFSKLGFSKIESPYSCVAFEKE